MLEDLTEIFASKSPTFIYMLEEFQVQVQVFIVLHCFLEKLINVLYKNAEIKKIPTIS